ncbi:uncharacterized protein LOC100301497 precursor [Bombyx mori]|uniref:Odorant binding protein n=2 Tax=cellular organisms TaxID=131567 RepID=C0SQ81_BOMMO|nr:uncharacterized protein LOC100301497 precursor [Bombyx mori]BAH36760.1 odorant binding protein [Bombyx mori]
MTSKVLLSCVVLAVLATTVLAEDSRKLVSFAPEVAKKLKVLIQECLNENGLGEDAIEVIRAGEYREDEPFQNLVYCAYKKFGALDENNRIISQVAAASFPKDIDVVTVIESCGKEDGNTPVDQVFKYFKCFQKNSPVRMQLY